MTRYNHPSSLLVSYHPVECCEGSDQQQHPSLPQVIICGDNTVSCSIPDSCQQKHQQQEQEQELEEEQQEELQLHQRFASDGRTITTTITIDDAIELVNSRNTNGSSEGGWFLNRIMLITSLSYAADGMQVILLSFLIPILQQEWLLSNYQTTMISSTLFVGATFGTILWGPLADSIGRRPIFLLATLVTTIGSCSMSMIPSNSVYCLVLNIFFIGFGVGGLTIPFDIFAEFLPTKQRGTQLLQINYAWTVGVIYVVIGAYICLQQNNNSSSNNNNSNSSNNYQATSYSSWRYFTSWCSIPCIVSLILGYYYIPESPRWLVSKGRIHDAMTILRNAAIINGSSDTNSIFPNTMTIQKESQERHVVKMYELLQPQYRGITLCLWGAWLTFAFGYFGTLLITTRIFSSTTTSTTSSTTAPSSSTSNENNSNNIRNDDASTNFDFIAIFISSIAEFIGTTVAIMVIDRMGRISSMVRSFVLAGLLLCLFCVLAAFNTERYLLLVFAFMARIFEMTATCILWVSTAEILTTEIRGAGHSSSNAFARIGAIFCPLLIQNNPSYIQVGMIMLLFHTFTAYCVSMLPETNGHKMGLGYTSTRRR